MTNFHLLFLVIFIIALRCFLMFCIIASLFCFINLAKVFFHTQLIQSCYAFFIKQFSFFLIIFLYSTYGVFLCTNTASISSITTLIVYAIMSVLQLGIFLFFFKNNLKSFIFFILNYSFLNIYLTKFKTFIILKIKQLVIFKKLSLISYTTLLKPLVFCFSFIACFFNSTPIYSSARNDKCPGLMKQGADGGGQEPPKPPQGGGGSKLLLQPPKIKVKKITKITEEEKDCEEATADLAARFLRMANNRNNSEWTPPQQLRRVRPPVFNETSAASSFRYGQSSLNHSESFGLSSDSLNTTIDQQLPAAAPKQSLLYHIKALNFSDISVHEQLTKLLNYFHNGCGVGLDVAITHVLDLLPVAYRSLAEIKSFIQLLYNQCLISFGVNATPEIAAERLTISANLELLVSIIDEQKNINSGKTLLVQDESCVQSLGVISKLLQPYLLDMGFLHMIQLAIFAETSAVLTGLMAQFFIIGLLGEQTFLIHFLTIQNFFVDLVNELGVLGSLPRFDGVVNTWTSWGSSLSNFLQNPRLVLSVGGFCTVGIIIKLTFDRLASSPILFYVNEFVFCYRHVIQDNMSQLLTHLGEYYGPGDPAINARRLQWRVGFQSLHEALYTFERYLNPLATTTSTIPTPVEGLGEDTPLEDVVKEGN